MSFGIYSIKNNITKKQYIGQTSNSFKKRFYEHINLLKNNKHDNRVLQNSFNKYGINNFSFDIIEEVNDIKLLDEKEIFYIDKLKTLVTENGFNILKGGNKPPKQAKKVYVYSLEKEILEKVFSSVKQCAKHFNTEKSNLSRHIKGEIVIPTLKNYYITFLENNNTNYKKIKKSNLLKSKTKNIFVYSLYDGSLYKTFNTLNECANYFNHNPIIISKFIKLDFKYYQSIPNIGKYIFSFVSLSKQELKTKQNFINENDKSLFVYKDNTLYKVFKGQKSASEFFDVDISVVKKLLENKNINILEEYKFIKRK